MKNLVHIKFVVEEIGETNLDDFIKKMIAHFRSSAFHYNLDVLDTETFTIVNHDSI